MVEATGISDMSVRAGESKIRIDTAAFESNGMVQWVTPDAAKMPFLTEVNAAFYTDCIAGDYSDMEYYLNKRIEAVLSYNNKSFRYTLKKICILYTSRCV